MPVARERPGHGIVRVVRIPEDAAADGAHLHTGRNLPRRGAAAVVALVRPSGHRMLVARAVGTGFDAPAAADAAFGIDAHASVVGLVGRVGRARLHAQGMVAVHTRAGLIGRPEQGKLVRRLADPVAGVAVRRAVTLLAGQNAGLAVDTFVGVYRHDITGHRILHGMRRSPRRFSRRHGRPHPSLRSRQPTPLCWQEMRSQ